MFDDWTSFAYPTSCEAGQNAAELHYGSSASVYSLPSGVYPVEYSALDTLSHEISVTVGEPSFQLFSEQPTTMTPESYEDSLNSPSPSSTRSSPFPETPAFDTFHSELPHIVSPVPTVSRDVTGQEEQQTSKVTQVVHPTYSPSPPPIGTPSPLSECELFPSSRCSSAAPSSQSSEYGSTTHNTDGETSQSPVKVVAKKTRRPKAGAIKKKKAKSKEKHFCCYCNESFTRDHDADRHQRTCKSNPNCSQKEKCKVCTKPLPVRLDARRRHWGTLECSDSARKLGFTRMDEDVYELI